MARDWLINGETLIRVKGPTGSSISSLSELGLAENPVTVSPVFKHEDLQCDAWGQGIVDIQFMLAELTVSFNLIHFDPDVLEECMRLAMGGPTSFGQVGRAGTRLGANAARFAAANKLIGLNLTSPVASRPWRFYYSYVTSPPLSFPLGTRKTVVPMSWRVIPYTTDPWQNGAGAANYVLWDRTADS